jgi:hypothetical protein
MPPTSAPIAAPATSTAAPAGFHVITDDLARLSVQAPTWWPEVNGSPVQLDDGTWPALSATSDSDAFADGFGPGLYLREAAFSADPSVLLADYAGGSLGQDCTPGGTQPLPNPAFSGVYRSWFDCAGTLNDVHVAAANPLDGRQVTVLAFVQLTDADAPALSTILSSIRLGGI